MDLINEEDHIRGFFQFIHDGSRQGQEIADFLCGLTKMAKAHGGADALVIKAQAGHLAGEVRMARAEKAGLLIKQAEEWDERARSGALSPEIRAYLEAKACDAREQAARLG